MVKEEAFELTRNAAGISEVDIAVSTGEGLQEIWRYQVLVGHSLVFKRSDTFSAYLENSAGVECGAGSTVDIAVMDASRRHSKSLLDTVRYSQVKEFQDRDLMLHLDVPEGKVVVAEQGQFVVIRGNVNTALDASDSYFSLLCTRIRKSLF